MRLRQPVERALVAPGGSCPELLEYACVNAPRDCLSAGVADADDTGYHALSRGGLSHISGGLSRRRQDGKAAKVTLGVIRSAVQAGLRQLFGSVGGAVPFEVVGTLAVEGAAIVKADRGCGLGAVS